MKVLFLLFVFFIYGNISLGQTVPLDTVIGSDFRTILFEGDRKYTGLPVLRTEPLVQDGNVVLYVDTVLKSLASWPKIERVVDARNRLYRSIRTNYKGLVEINKVYGFDQNNRYLVTAEIALMEERILCTIHLADSLIQSIYISEIVSPVDMKTEVIFTNVFGQPSTMNNLSFKIPNGSGLSLSLIFSKVNGLTKLYFMNQNGLASGLSADFDKSFKLNNLAIYSEGVKSDEWRIILHGNENNSR